jgi:hypothetical protein
MVHVSRMYHYAHSSQFKTNHIVNAPIWWCLLQQLWLQVARDIEDPYLYDPNELPLPQMQYKLNERLLAIGHSDRPLAFTDVAELKGPGNTILMPGSGNADVRSMAAVRWPAAAGWRLRCWFEHLHCQQCHAVSLP